MPIVGKLPIDTSPDSQKTPTITPTGTIRRSPLSTPVPHQVPSRTRCHPPQIGATHHLSPPTKKGAWHLRLPADRRGARFRCHPRPAGVARQPRICAGLQPGCMAPGLPGTWTPPETAHPTSEGCSGGEDRSNYAAPLRFCNVHDDRRTAVHVACGLGDPPDGGSASVAPVAFAGKNRPAAHPALE